MQMWGISEREKHQKIKCCLKIWDRNNISFKLQSCNNHSARCAVCSVQRAVCTSSGHWHKQLRDLRSRESREKKNTQGQTPSQLPCVQCVMQLLLWTNCNWTWINEILLFTAKEHFCWVQDSEKVSCIPQACCVFLNITAIKNCSSC